MKLARSRSDVSVEDNEGEDGGTAAVAVVGGGKW